MRDTTQVWPPPCSVGGHFDAACTTKPLDDYRRDMEWEDRLSIHGNPTVRIHARRMVIDEWDTEYSLAALQRGKSLVCNPPAPHGRRERAAGAYGDKTSLRLVVWERNRVCGRRGCRKRGGRQCQSLTTPAGGEVINER